MDSAANNSGIDTISFSAGGDIPYQSGGIISQNADEVNFNSAGTLWGNGDGLNGDVLRPEDGDSLLDILDNLEIDTSIYSNDYLRYSSVNSTLVAFRQNGEYLFEKSIGGHADSRVWNFSGGPIEKSITNSADTIDVEYSTDFDYVGTQRDIVQQISNRTNPGDSVVLFVRPDNIINHGIFWTDNSRSNGTSENPEPNDYQTLSENSPLAIEIKSEIVEDIRYALTNPATLENDDLRSLSTESGNGTNITIKLADYADSDGNIDFQKLNEEQRFNLEIANDASDRLTRLDEVWADARFRAGEEHGGAFLSLREADHDTDGSIPTYSGGQLERQAVEDLVETTFEGNTEVELGLSPDNFYIPVESDGNLPSSITYFYENINAGFRLTGNHSPSAYVNQFHGNLVDSIQSITLDLTDYTVKTHQDPLEDTSLEFTTAPILTTIDFGTFTNETEFISVNNGNLTSGNFEAHYNLYNADPLLNISSIGGLTLGSVVSQDSDQNYAVGNVHHELPDYSQVKSHLNSLYIYGEIGDRQGNLSVNIDYDIANDSYTVNQVNGWGWGSDYDSPSSLFSDSNIQLNWEQFADLNLVNLQAGISDDFTKFEIETYLDDCDEAIELTYNLYRQSDYLDDEAVDGVNPLNQLAVLGDSVDNNSRFVLDIDAVSLESGWNIESTDITIQFDPNLFGSIHASDIKIGGALPIANAVHIDNENGSIRIAAASLSDLSNGTGIYDKEALASISLDFSEDHIELLDKNSDGSLTINPLTFDISVDQHETNLSYEFIDEDGLINREILSLDQLGGDIAVWGQEVTLYEAKINLEQQGDGLVLGTNRVIGSDASYTNLVRKGDTLTTSATWLNVGNIEANNLAYSGMLNENAELTSGSFSKTSLASGSFVDGHFEEDAREETRFTGNIEITGEAGNVVNLSEGIVSIRADGTQEVFNNKGKGSSNLITFQGDLNYDGRVSMKDLAYLNAGAARQVDVTQGGEGDFDNNGTLDESVARDVDADFNGKIDISDLSVLDKDWGKTLHTGDQDFQGSSHMSWEQLDFQGEYTRWDNDSFKDQNSTEADPDYAGSLESPTSNAIGADDNQSVGDGGIDGEAFQDPLAV
ncbi:hypothetical protein [Synechococcus sp. MU1617]|uniref:hypothetical protein n=1 Tax=Synechococcus sp. MU1617 TaxID=2508346 RepID=UPI001CF81B35|nr:hypothetical protein [Synechococcus sp. MU1617]MCB4390308.1 hypothetical protein [Synechococcus sp. MU1617]